MPAAAGWARLRSVGFTDTLHGHSVKSRLVLKHLDERAVGPLVEPLVRLRSVVDPLPDPCQITHYHCADPSLVEGLDQPRGLLVQEILDLVPNLREVPVLRPDEPPAAPTAALLAGDLLGETRFRAILLTTQAAKLSSIDGP